MKRFLRSEGIQRLIAWAAATYVVLVARSLRWRILGEAQLLAMARGTPLIVVFWHETLPSMPVLWLRARRLGLARPAVVLASRHRDGQLIGAAVKHLGLELISGSSSRGGAAALRALIKALAGGAHVGLTPDGPRGPRRVCAPGAAQLAAMSGVPVLPCGVMISPAWTLKTWDGMRLPLPFGRGVLVAGAPLRIARADWQGGVVAITAALNAAMDQAASRL